jgi:glyoxylate/hydroxypyruvate reductase A
MKPALLIATKGWNAEDWRRCFGALLPDRTILVTEPDGLYHGPADDLADVHYGLVWKPRQELLDALPALKVIFSLGAGVDHVLTLPRLPDVPLVRTVADDLTGRMVEYVVWQALHHLRRGAVYHRLQSEHRGGDLKQPAAHEVSVGILGLGVMGVASADVLLRLGFQVRGWTRTPKEVPDVEVFAGPEALDSFLAGTDILVSLLPLTAETRRLVDGALLRKLRRDGPLGGPAFINAGRGATHVEADLAEALRDGTLSGASLDVFETEPLPADSPLWDFDNLVITPHVAAVSDAPALAAQVAGQIEAFERGEPLKNRVDPKRGY